MDRNTRRLTRIERRLVADDPQLGQAFVLWNQRCSAVTSPVDDQVPVWVLATVLLVLPAWVMGHYAMILAAGLGAMWLVLALAADDPGSHRAPSPSEWWT